MSGTHQALLMIGGAGGGSGSTTVWNSADKSGTVSLTNSDLTATFPNDGNNKGVRTNTGYSGDFAVYFEVNVDDFGQNHLSNTFGMKSSGSALNNASTEVVVAASTTAAIFYGSTISGGSPGFTTADVVMVAVKRVGTAVSAWFGLNGTWHDGGDPSAGTGANATGTSSDTMHGYASMGDFLAQKVCTLNCGATAFAYTKPTGFSAL